MRSAGRADAELRTFLIADIRGWTSYTATHGADAAADLAARFAAIVRGVVSRHDGVVLELRGDEALVVFELARRALRAALEIQSRVTEELPLGVGIGLDAGEAVPFEGGYRGAPLNLAARLCAQAQAGVTYASEAVVHLAATVDGVGYAEARTFRLKGIDGPVRAARVVPAERGLGVPTRYGRDKGRDRGMLAVGGVVGLAALVVVGLVLAGLPNNPASPQPSGTGLSGSPTSSLTHAPSSTATTSPTASDDPFASSDLPLLAYVGPTTGEILDIQPVHAPTDTSDFEAGSFWLLTLDPVSYQQIDAETHQVVRSLTFPLGEPGWTWVAPDIVWATYPERSIVSGIDIRTGLASKEFAVPLEAGDERTISGVTVGAGSLWVSLVGDESRPDEVLRLDPTSGEIEARIGDLAYPEILAFGEGATWFTGNGSIGRIDPATNELSFSVELGGPRFAQGAAFLPFIEFGGGAAWTANDERGKVWRVDRNGAKTEFDVGVGARALARSGSTVWVAVQDEGKLVGIDVVTDAMRELNLGHQVSTVAADGDELMVALDLTPEEHVAGLEGEVLTIASPGEPFSPPDTATNGSFEGRQLAYATCAGLLRYPDAPAPDGWQLEPEVAARMPTVSADKRTYEFELRSDFRFSPPSNELITAETFKYSIERTLSVSFFGYWLDDIDGVEAFRAGDARSVSGIVADGSELSITIVAPAGDFLHRLSLPYFCPVPVGTPIAADIDPTPPVAAGGPYFVTKSLNGELLIAEKNPNYPGLREGPWDAIAWRYGFTPGEVIARVDEGRVGAATGSPFDVLINPQSERAQRWGPGSDSAQAGDQRWFGGPRFGTEFLYLNPARLLGDLDVRRAVALTIDRAALAAWSGEQPFAGLLAPSVPGSLPADAAIPAPDVEAARGLMAGRTGSLVMGYIAGCDPCQGVAETVRGQLAQIGISVTVSEREDLLADIARPDTELDLYSGFLDTDFPDPAALLQRLGDSRWIGDANLDELDRLLVLEGQPRIDAAAALATKVSDDEVLAIPYAYPVYPMYLGEHVGCGFVQPAIGAVDLLSLCPEP